MENLKNLICWMFWLLISVCLWTLCKPLIVFLNVLELKILENVYKLSEKSKKRADECRKRLK